MSKLTIKQDKFCSYYIETGSATEAYRMAYDASRMKAETIHRTSKELIDNHKIAARVEELKRDHADRHRLTVDDLLMELEEARQAALCAETVQASAAASATMGKAKLLGLDKQVIDHTSSDGSMTPTRIEIVAPSYDDKTHRTSA